MVIGKYNGSQKGQFSWGSQNRHFRWKGITKMSFFQYSGSLKTTIFGKGSLANVTFCLGIIHLNVVEGRYEHRFCILSVSKCYLRVSKCHFLYMGVWKMALCFTRGIKNARLHRVIENAILLILEYFLYTGVKFSCMVGQNFSFFI